MLSPGGSDHDHGTRGRTGAGFIRSRSVFADRISVCCLASFWRQYGDNCAAACTDIKGGNSLTGLDYRIFRSGSGPSVEWADVVWMPGKAVLFHFLCIPDAADADGGVSECATFLPVEGKRTGQQRRDGKDPLSDLPGEGHYPFLLSAYA